MIIKTHGPYLFDVTPNMELMTIVRYHEEVEKVKDWNKDNEEASLTAANQVTDYLERCIANRKAIYHFLKDLNNGEKKETTQTEEQSQAGV